jgi:1-piperideine-2-carboxylate/1-pyrroline-2-carboxylate reductase [NAD(P)H]
VLGVTEARIASRSPASAQKLADHASSLGMKASVVTDVDAQLRDCPLVVTCTPADAVVLRAAPRSDAFLAAVGAFTPSMVELDPALCRHIADHGTIVIDTPAARHEAGDLLQAGLDLERFCDLRAILLGTQPMARGPVLFKSCGWAGWDLAAARCAVAHME